MTKIVMGLLAFVLGIGVVDSKVDLVDEHIKAEKKETIEANEALAEEEYVDNGAAYADYLSELAAVGPKEGEHIVPVQPEFKEVPLVTTIKESKPLGEQSESPKKEVQQKEKEIETETVGVVDHAPFGQLLKKHVNARGDVDYDGFKRDQDKLEAYIKTLSANPVSNKMSKNERLAYWINVYNAYTIKLILDNYPIKSIKDIENGKPWDKLFIKLGSTSYSLNDIENNIIRKRFTEPRIHFAVNCAAASCPPLLNDAYYPNTLINQLDERTRSFLKNTKYNTFSTNKIAISKIFEWYGVDFGDIKSYLSPYVDVNLKDAAVTYKVYDWSLNKQ